MRMIIGGEWTSGARQEELRSPYNNEVIDTVPVADVGDVDRAVAAAVRGAEHQRRLSAYEREAILRRAGDITDARVDDLARTISGETGKPIAEARAEASRVGDLLRLCGFEGSQLYGESLPLDAAPNAGTSRLGFTLRQPCGVVVAITPFNFPALLVIHKIGPALATGNAVVLKPARQTPLTALMLCEIFLEAGLHPEAISCITGPGDVLGDALCADPRVRKISFTGSSETGERITRVAGVKKLSLELGASCPVVILPDADIESAAGAIAIGGYANAGQVCISVQRVVADRSVVGDLLDALVPKVQAIKLGDPAEPDTTLGSLISERDAIRVEEALREGSGNGAQIVTGGERSGSVLTPAVVANVDPSSPLSQDELFGPAVAVSTARDVDHAIELANATRYGLAAGVFTQDLSNAIRFAREVDSGNVHVNWTPLWRADLMPYGGLKGSGIGKEGPRYAVEEMTDLKTVILHGVRP
jgi:acyl-CoA reductase-like NAD-dependent aldehyde dehydrogenase